MSRGKRQKRLPQETEAALAALRQQLEQAGAWPPGGDQLLRDLAQPRQPASPLTEETIDMLSLVISDALQGIDIFSRYPSFYQQLLANAELRDFFLDALELLEKSQSGKLQPLPGPPSHDLSFLQTAAPRPLVESPAPGRWRATWQQSVAQLQALLAGTVPSPDAARRATLGLLEDDYLMLLRSQAEVEGARYEVMLEATWADDDPDALRLHLTAVVLGHPHTGAPLPPLQAHVTWGHYQATALVDRNSRAVFPPLPFSDVSDEAGTGVAADLRLSLEPVAP